MGRRFFQVRGYGDQIGEAEQPEEIALRFVQIEQHQIAAALSQLSLTRRDRPDRRAGQHGKRCTVQDQPMVPGFHDGVGVIPKPVDVAGIDPSAKMEHCTAGDPVNQVKPEREAPLPNVQTFDGLLGLSLRSIVRHGHESIATARTAVNFRNRSAADETR